MSGAGLLRAADRVASRWANGGGITREVVAWPDPGDWQWRISLAEVAESGPFSILSDVDRTIVLVSQGRLALDFGTHAIELSRWVPFDFRGEAPVFGRIGGTATEDLNVMTRRGHFTSVVRVFSSSAEMFVVAGVERVVVLLAGSGRVQMGDLVYELGPGDAFHTTEAISVSASLEASLAIIEIHPVSGMG